MLIRAETPQDVAAISSVIEAAFADHPHSSQTEHLLVATLRTAGVLLVSLVAEEGGQVVGHVAFSPVQIGEEDRRWVGLGPVSVSPDLQRRGIGKALVKAGLDAAKAQGAHGCVVLGDPNYYSRFGFRPVRKLVLADVPPEYFLALPFTDTLPEGQVTYHPAFDVCA